MTTLRQPAKAKGFAAVALVAIGASVAQAFGRFTYGVLLPAIRDDLGISNTVAGSLGTVNVGAYLVGTIVVAAATSSYRLLHVMRVGFLFSLTGLIVSALSTGPWILGIAMFSSGLGGAMIWIPAPVIAAGAIAPERRGLAVGLMGSGIGVGIIFTGQLSGYVRSALGDESWRTVYGIQAAIGVVVLFATLTFLDHDQEKPAGQRAGVGGFQVVRRMRGWAALTAAYASYGLMYLLIVAFLTTRLEDDNGWTSQRASLAFTTLGIAVVLGGPMLITLAKRIGPSRALAGAFTLWSMLAILILPGWFAATIAAVIGFGLLFAGIPGLITLYVVENTSLDDFGPSFAAATLAFGVAQMVSPQLGGLIADLTGSFTLVFFLSSGFALVGTAAALRLPRRVL